MDGIIDGKDTPRRIEEILKDNQKSNTKISNNPLFIGLICVFISLIGSYFIATYLDAINLDRPTTAEIQIIDFKIDNVNPKQNLYDIGVDLRIENPKYFQRSITIDEISININVPDEVRPELVNISDYYISRNWMDSPAYSSGTNLTIKPGEVAKIDSHSNRHQFALSVSGKYKVRVRVDYYDSLSKRPPLYGYFDISIGKGAIYTNNLEFPIKLESSLPTN